MTEHTPTPWVIEDDTDIRAEDWETTGEVIATCHHPSELYISCTFEDAIANARHIVRCVNSHDALVKALEECAQDLAEEIEAKYPKGTRKYPSESRRYTSDMQTVMRARAALAAAKEEKEG